MKSNFRWPGKDKQNPNAGENARTARLSDAEIRDLRRRMDSGEPVKDVSANTGIPKPTLSHIKNRRTRKGVEPK